MLTLAFNVYLWIINIFLEENDFYLDRCVWARFVLDVRRGVIMLEIFQLYWHVEVC
jgi:hypothetical protein